MHHNAHSCLDGRPGLPALLPDAAHSEDHPRLGRPIDRTMNSLPIFGRLYGDANLYYGVGWSGNGVGPSVVGGKILASLALDYDDEWSKCGLIARSARSFPPEPIRFAGAHIVREALVRKEEAEALEKRPRRLAVALSKLAPTGLEDH
jgi:glycine/D-amino acid oxidase-like deaminating enzyme